MTPAETVIQAFGAYKLAEALQIAPSTVYRWSYDKSRDGCGGQIPRRYFELIMDAAKKTGTAVTKKQLELGRPEVRIIRASRNCTYSGMALQGNYGDEG